MSVVSILGGDWEIKFSDEVVGSATTGLKSIKHITGTSVVTANVLYSAVADAMDELDSMDDENPMLPTTPNAYTLENEYFIDNLSTEFISGGSINSTNWTNNIVCKVYTETTPFIAGDIGDLITEADSGPDTGTLLDYETLPDGTKVLWIRPDGPTDLFDATTGNITSSGTGAGTVSAVATTGEQLWSNVNVIGGIDGFGANTSEVYLFQDRIKIPQFWSTDPTVSGGIIDILVRTQNSTVAAFPVIAAGIVEVFNRRYTSQYDNFSLDISAGGTNSLPLATAPDINNTTGYRSATWNTGTGTAMEVGDLITNTTVAGSYAICTAVTDSGATGLFQYYIVGDLTDLVNTNGFTSSDTGGNKRIAVVNSVPAANDGGPTDPDSGEGGTVTVTLGFTDVDHRGNGVTEPYSIEIDAKSNVPTEKVYERLKYITRRGATAAELFATPTTQDGESFRGLQLYAPLTGAPGTFTEGDDITNETVATGIQAGIVLAAHTTLDYVTLTDTTGGFSAADVLQDESTDQVTLSGAPTVITPVKASPFGTLAGGTFFGARGVVLINPASGDEKDAELIDDLGVANSPPNTVSVELTNLVDQDVLFIADDDGTAGVIDKNRFGGGSIQAAEATTIVTTGAIEADVPKAGYVRMVDVTLPVSEQRYRYSTWAGSTFTLITHNDAGTLQADAGGSATVLKDSAGGFTAADIQFGDIIMNITDGSQATVVSKDSDVQLTTTALTGGVSDDWALADVYKIGVTDRAYVAADNVYAPILDRRVEAADGDTVNNSLVQASPFGIVVNVRQGKIILPFTQNTTVEASGRSLSVIRNDDTIAT